VGEGGVTPPGNQHADQLLAGLVSDHRVTTTNLDDPALTWIIDRRLSPTNCLTASIT
jgi:hypothetical protein